MKNFKALMLLIATSFLFTITSCEKDDEVSPITAPIEGEWNKEDIDMQILLNGMDFIDYLINFGGLTREEAEEALELMFDATDFPFNIIFDEEGYYHASMSPTNTHTGTFVLNTDNNTLTLDNGTEDQVIFDVVTLNETDLKIKNKQISNIDDDFPEAGKMEVTMIIELKRVQ